MLKIAVRFDFGAFFMCLRVVDDWRFLPCLCSGQCFLRYGAMTFETQDQVIILIGGGISLFACPLTGIRMIALAARLCRDWKQGLLSSRGSNPLRTWRLNAGG